MNRAHLISVILAVLSLAAPLGAAIPSGERLALLALFDRTGGPGWIDADGWGGEPGTECDWYGITCDELQNAVIRVTLTENHLDGELPDEMGQLSALVELDLSRNLIRGSIPSSIGNLDQLRSLDLRDNDLILPLPSDFFTLIDLEVLDLSGNLLEGAIPAALGSMSGLTALRLSHNALRGEIPPELTGLTALDDGALDLSYNALKASDSTVAAFVDQKHDGGTWRGTQTVPPTDLSINLDGLLWTPAEYTEDRGTYRVIIDRQSGGRAAVLAAASKSSSSFRLSVGDVVGELVATLHTVTEPHGRQKNLLISAPSEPLEFSQFGFAPDFPFFALGVPPEPLIQVGGIQQNTTFFTVLNYGGAGGDALLEPQDDFFNLSETSFFLDAFATRRVDVSSVTRPPGDYSGEVLFSGDGLFDAISIPVSLVSLPAPPDADGAPERTRLDVVSGRSPLTATAFFRNDGNDVLEGIVEADVAWIEPITEAISIAPGETASIEYQIDPERRPDGFSEEGISFSGTLRLQYPEEVEVAGKGTEPRTQHTTGVSTTLATVVNTVPPEVTSEGFPTLEPGERRHLVPGLTDGDDRFSDVSIANSFGSINIDDMEAYFAPIGNVSLTQQARFPELVRRAAFLLAAPVQTVFDLASATGSIQLRSSEADSLLVSARLLSLDQGGGLLGTALPVFGTSRLAAPGEDQILTGLEEAAHGTLFVQNAGAGPVTVDVELLDARGARLTQIGPLQIEGWDTVELDDFLVPQTATGIVRNDVSSSSPVSAHAILSDDSTADRWVVLDWSRYWAEPRSAPMLLPVARHIGPAVASSSRRRSVERPVLDQVERTGVTLTLFNETNARAAARLSFHPTEGDVSERVVILEPRETRMLSDVVATELGRSGTVDGYIRIVPLRGAIVPSAHLVTTGTDGSLVGSSIPLHPRGAGMRLGERRSIAALEDSRRATIDQAIPGTWRSNVSLLETSGRSVTVSATLRIPTGQSLAAATVRRDFELAPNQMLRLGPVAQAIMGNEREDGATDLHDLQLDLFVSDGDGSVIVVTEMIESATGDSMIRFD